MMLLMLLLARATSGFQASSSSSRRACVFSVAVYPPQYSGYVQPDEDEKENRFDPWPETYKPNPDYPGTCVPGLGRENQPLAELDLEIHHEDIAFYEVPFHLRWPSNHPYLLGPYDRLELAGRFVDGDQIDATNRKNRKQRTPPKLESVEKLEVFGKTDDDAVEREEDEEDRDPTFDDTSSSLLDAALGLGGTPPTQKKRTPPASSPNNNKKTKKKQEDDDDEFLFD